MENTNPASAEVAAPKKTVPRPYRSKEATKLFNADKELIKLNKSMVSQAAAIDFVGKEIALQKQAKNKLAEKLINAGNDLSFQFKEKKKRAAELVVTNNKLSSLILEKEKLASELIKINKTLSAQNLEKEDRAAELLIANRELVFQNKEKEKRATELIAANKELIYQNREKEKRAAELHVANEELSFQNSEKGKRALELESAIKELESFSYSVSHDLRAPLRAINGFTEVLMEDYIEQFNDDAKELLNEIISNSHKMGELIDNLLEFSRIGKQHVSRGDINVKALVDSVINELMQIQPKRKIEFTVKPLENIKADRNMLKQVFVNLISNASKYSGKKEKPEIEIGCYDENDARIYYCKDNGVGFDMRYYDKLFGVFQRLHSNSEFEGTGVGLAIIQKIITKHAGKVWAEAKVNEGACFYISLPNT